MSISDIWDDGLRSEYIKQKPIYFFAVDESGEKYYVAKDDSTILYLVHHDAKISTFVIPKRRATVVDDEYQIESSKLNMISCSSSQMDDYATFVAKYIINKTK